MYKSTAIAHPNVALVKYWGKRNAELILPQNASISVTLDGAQTITTIELDMDLQQHEFYFRDGSEPFYRRISEGKELERVIGQIELIMKIADVQGLKARVISRNDFPTGAGLASSASGAAALVVAACDALNNFSSNKPELYAPIFDGGEKELSILSRRGSGSSCRSIYSGFVEWLKGEKEDGSDSYAVQLADENYWPDFRVVTAIMTAEKKKLTSRAGMEQTVRTCPLYHCWLQSVEDDLSNVRNGIKQRDFDLVGRAAEHNALKMHSLMFTTKPAIIYWLPSTLQLINEIYGWREDGIKAYFTIDAGPQVKILCLQTDLNRLENRLKVLSGIERIIVNKPGQGAHPTDKHLSLQNG